MRIAYCDCFSGISGDMFTGALLDAGLPLEELKAQINTLGLDEPFELDFRIVEKRGLRAGLFEVKMAHGEHEHSHSTSDHHHHHHHHRHLSDILEIIDHSAISAGAKRKATAIFNTLGRAESQVHGVDIEQVHFHEVGALDSIVDIVSAAIGLEYLGIERLYASALPVGTGVVQTEHGLLPLPAPATLELMRIANMPTIPSTAQKELVTPTGAAILATLATFERPAMRMERVGNGAGQRDLPWANLFRLLVGEDQNEERSETVLLEANIDDMPGEAFGYVLQKLFTAGALDVFFTPIYMKKNRPGVMLGVICRRSDEAQLAHLVLSDTSTFGLRVTPVRRYEAGRRVVPVDTIYGTIRIKIKELDGRAILAAPEYEDCARLAELHKQPFLTIFQNAQEAGQKLLN